MKNSKVKGPACNTGVRKIEDWPEEQNIFASPNWDPTWERGIDNREVEHIHYLAEQELGVSSPLRKQLCNISEGALAKDNTVEQGVENIAKCAAHDGCQSE